MKSATIVWSPTVTSPGAGSLGGQVLAPRDFRDRGGTGMRVRGVRVDALRGDLDVRGFRGSRWLRWLRSLSQARTNPTTAIRVTVMSPGTTAMWLMVVFSGFSRIPCCVATRGFGEIPSRPHDPGSAARGAPGCCLRVPGPEDEPGRRDAGPDEDHPVGPDDGRQGHRKISIDVLKPSIHDDRIPGVLLCPVGVAASGSPPRLTRFYARGADATARLAFAKQKRGPGAGVVDVLWACCFGPRKVPRDRTLESYIQKHPGLLSAWHNHLLSQPHRQHLDIQDQAPLPENPGPERVGDTYCRLAMKPPWQSENRPRMRIENAERQTSRAF